MKGISQRVMLPQSDLLPKEGTKGAEIRAKGIPEQGGEN